MALNASNSLRTERTAALEGNAVDRQDLAPVAATRILASSGGIPDFSGLTARQAVVRSAEIGLRATLHGSGMVGRQSPAPGTAVAEAGEVLQLWLGPAAEEAGR